MFAHVKERKVGRSRRLFRITDNDGGAALCCHIVKWQQRTFDSGFYGRDEASDYAMQMSREIRARMKK